MPIRIGVFAGIYGDEPEGVRALAQLARLLESRPDLARGYCLFLYPVCNPTGLEDCTRHSRSGKDLNREFWRNSSEPEVRLLQAQLVSQNFAGIISLHTKGESRGFCGSVRGPRPTRRLLRPAISAAAELVPINSDRRDERFRGKDGLSEEAYEGVLSAPPKTRPRPFELRLGTPGQAPVFLRELALVVALRSILTEYRKSIADAPNL